MDLKYQLSRLFLLAVVAAFLVGGWQLFIRLVEGSWGSSERGSLRWLQVASEEELAAFDLRLATLLETTRQDGRAFLDAQFAEPYHDAIRRDTRARVDREEFAVIEEHPFYKELDALQRELSGLIATYNPLRDELVRLRSQPPKEADYGSALPLALQANQLTALELRLTKVETEVPAFLQEWSAFAQLAR